MLQAVPGAQLQWTGPRLAYCCGLYTLSLWIFVRTYSRKLYTVFSVLTANVSKNSCSKPRTVSGHQEASSIARGNDFVWQPYIVHSVLYRLLSHDLSSHSTENTPAMPTLGNNVAETQRRKNTLGSHQISVHTLGLLAFLP